MSDRLRRADSAAIPATLGVTLYALMSDNLLVSLGIPYNIPGGSQLAKLHPGTWVIGAAFLWLVTGGNPVRNLGVLARRTPAVAVLLVAALAALVDTMVLYGSSGSAFVIDTFLAPGMLAFVLREAEPRHARRVFVMLVGASVFNALLGLGEAMTQRHLIPYMAGDVPILEDHFRATALGGHPLANAKRTAVMMCAVFVLRPVALIAALVPVLGLALLAFGSRAALVVALGVLLAWATVRMVRGMVSRSGGGGHGLAVMLGLAALPAAAWSLDLGKRIADNFYWDTSAQSRLLVFKVFDHLDSYDLWVGIGAGNITEILDRLKGSTTLTDLENFWILLLLQFGLVFFVPLAIGLLATVFSLGRSGGVPTRLAAVVFLVLASSNNSLATKTQALALAIPVLIGSAAMRKREEEPAAATVAAAPTRRSNTLFRLPPGSPTPDPTPKTTGHTLFRRPPG